MRVYLDHNATTPVAKEVLDAMLPYYQERFGNASSTHLEGQEARHAVENARQQLADALSCEPDEIVFTSGGTESDNLALLGLARSYAQPGDRILISAIEHPAVRECGRFLGEMGYRVETIPVDHQGQVDIAQLMNQLDDEVRIIAVMAANNETGVIQPVEDIGGICEERGIFFHIDAVQAMGKIPVDPRRWKCHTLAISGHKIYGPKGTGALYVRKGTQLVPLQFGGTHERGRRPGTENVPGIVGLGKAVERISLMGPEANVRIQKLRDYLENAIREVFPDVIIHGIHAPRVPNTSLMSFPGMDGETLMMQLDLEGFAVSTGSACASGRIEPSHVLEAMGVPPEIARGTIRVSLGMSNTREDIERFVETIARLISKTPTHR